ncbi:MAG: PAS domain-containing protein [Anaeromyxobacter sp.]|nr:PAS domain-containing protein [Anaeromyxobacter sp.]MBL0275742.1 PAS domain-containing protein [Anaeromyxobacter sp.]
MAETAGAPADPALHKKLVWLTFFRLVSVTVLLVGTVAVSWNVAEEKASFTGPLYGLVIGTYLAALASAWWLRLGRALRPLAYAQIAFDVATAAAVVGFTGWAESVFVFMFSLAIVNGAILLYRRGALIALLLALLTYLGLELLLARAAGAPPWPLLFVHAGAFAATAALAGYLAEQLRHTGERLAERESDLAAITALHESIVQSVTSGLVTLDVAGRVTFLNRAGEQIMGLGRREVVGQPAARWFAAFRTDTARGETDLVAAGGAALRLGYSTFPLLGRSGRALGTAVIFQDLTELRAMEVRLGRSERLADLGQLAAGLAHELRNPLASMMGSVELLRASSLGEDDRRLLDIVLREGGRLAQLVTEFLAFARPTPPRREPVDLAALAAETLEAFTFDPAAAGLELARRLEPATTRGDADQLRQVLWNLLVNAAQALGAGSAGGGRGRIEVACGPAPGGGALLSVADDGPGIDPEDRPRLFTPFFTTKPEGTGLGLATIHRIVDAHGGAVAVEGEPGRGARFTVRLPGAAGPAPG